MSANSIIACTVRSLNLSVNQGNCYVYTYNQCTVRGRSLLAVVLGNMKGCGVCQFNQALQCHQLTCTASVAIFLS